MKRHLAAAIVVAFTAAACASSSNGVGDSQIDPVKIIRDEKTNVARLALTSDAARRLDIQSMKVTGNVVPYAALLYTADGKTWVFTRPAPLEFVRAEVAVADIRGDDAVLRRGLAAGTEVVTTGAAELLGAESGVGEE